MFIANPKRTFGEVRGLNSPAGATMVAGRPFVALDDPQDPARQATIASGAENAVTAVSAATGPVSCRWTYGQFARLPPVVLSPICALSATLGSLPPRRRSSVDLSDVVLDRGCGPRAA